MGPPMVSDTNAGSRRVEIEAACRAPRTMTLGECQVPWTGPGWQVLLVKMNLELADPVRIRLKQHHPVLGVLPATVAATVYLAPAAVGVCNPDTRVGAWPGTAANRWLSPFLDAASHLGSRRDLKR